MEGLGRSCVTAGTIALRKHCMIKYPSIKAGRSFLACVTCLGLVCGVQLEAGGPSSAIVSKPVPVSDPPETRSPVSLKAINDPNTGKAAFSFNGREDPPVIRANPGEDIRLTYTNAMSTHSQEQCVDGPCMNMTNLHFHGLHVSPDAPQDDVITMMAMPGQLLHYIVNIPLDQPPGLYWYHTHPHGESYQQDLDGMSGAIVIDGLERYDPELQHMRERILVLRDRVAEGNDRPAVELRRRVDIPVTECGASSEAPERIFTVSGAVRPQIAIAPGERQFWRIVNASPDLYADLQVDTEQLEIVALDGMPLSFHDPRRRVELRDHLVVPPAGRVEAIVTGPSSGAQASLRTRCYDTGPDGDPNPAMVVADMVATPQPPHGNQTASAGLLSPVYKPVPPRLIARMESSPSDFVVTFTEDKKGFYINGKKY